MPCILQQRHVASLEHAPQIGLADGLQGTTTMLRRQTVIPLATDEAGGQQIGEFQPFDDQGMPQ